MSAPASGAAAVAANVAWIAFGANEGDRASTFAQALARLRAAGLRIDQTSHLYETTPVADSPGGRGLDPTASRPFLNAALRVSTELGPHELMRLLLAIETALGRDRRAATGDRTCDLDLLAMDDLRLDTQELVLPHPRLQRRAFVLVPLCELDPLLRIPLGRNNGGETGSDDGCGAEERPTVGSLLARLDTPAGAVRLWSGP